MSSPLLSSSEAIQLAETYREKYKYYLEGRKLKYSLVGCKYTDTKCLHSNDPVWYVTFDVLPWDDMWYSVIVSDLQKEVLCCSSTWQPIFYPHKKAVAK